MKETNSIITEIYDSWNNFVCYPKEEQDPWHDLIPYPKGIITAPKGTREFFEQNSEFRYSIQPYIIKLIDLLNLRDKKLLEIGCGIGEDLVQFSKRGAICYGIDLTENAIELTKRNLEYNNCSANLKVQDADKLPFQDGFFDIVYSMGVLHHSPDISSKIGEIHRVLKKGGKAVVMLYHKNFLTYYVNLFFIRYILGLGFISKSFDQIRNELEYKGCPYTMLYSKRECRELFKRFSRLDFQVEYFDKGHLRFFGKIAPQTFLDKLGENFGFHLLIFAYK